MHMGDHEHAPGERTVPVRYILEDPQELTSTDQAEWELHAAEGESLLDVALNAGINIEHACGGVCACSTCHIYIEDGMEHLTEADDEEEDSVEEAPAIQPNSRLACQSCVAGEGPITVRVPAWNRNAVKETPH